MDALTYFNKRHLSPENILYICRKDNKTIVHPLEGESVASLIPVHEMQSVLPPEDFISISKGVLVRRDCIAHISHDGVYTMTDGRTFQGRKRNLSEHRRLCRRLGLDIPSPDAPFKPPLGFYEKCAILDEMPLAYCVIELVFDENGHGVDFVFRYCNKQMALVEGVPVEQMLNRSFYEVFQNGDKKWLVAYADVALNGAKRSFHDFSPEIGKMLTIHCYQPEPGFCACVLLTE